MPGPIRRAFFQAGPRRRTARRRRADCHRPLRRRRRRPPSASLVRDRATGRHVPAEQIVCPRLDPWPATRPAGNVDRRSTSQSAGSPSATASPAPPRLDVVVRTTASRPTSAAARTSGAAGWSPTSRLAPLLRATRSRRAPRVRPTVSRRVDAALAQWAAAPRRPRRAIRILDSRTYALPRPRSRSPTRPRLAIEAANGERPLLARDGRRLRSSTPTATDPDPETARPPDALRRRRRGLRARHGRPRRGSACFTRRSSPGARSRTAPRRARRRASSSTGPAGARSTRTSQVELAFCDLRRRSSCPRATPRHLDPRQHRRRPRRRRARRSARRRPRRALTDDRALDRPRPRPRARARGERVDLHGPHRHGPHPGRLRPLLLRAARLAHAAALPLPARPRASAQELDAALAADPALTSARAGRDPRLRRRPGSRPSFVTTAVRPARVLPAPPRDAPRDPHGRRGRLGDGRLLPPEAAPAREQPAASGSTSTCRSGSRPASST